MKPKIARIAALSFRSCLVVLALALVAACTGDDAAPAPPSPAPESQRSDAPTGESGAEAAPSARAYPEPPEPPRPPADPFQTAWSAWRNGGESQQAWAALMERALQNRDREQTELMLRELARRMSVWRPAGWEAPTVKAVQRWAAASTSAQRQSIDPRAYVPALELLIDIGDAAAIERLVGDDTGGAAADSFDAARAVAASIVPNGTLDVKLDCNLRVDGDPVPPPPIGLRPGSHEFACVGGPTITLGVRAGERVYLVMGEGDAPAVGAPPTE